MCARWKEQGALCQQLCIPFWRTRARHQSAGIGGAGKARDERVSPSLDTVDRDQPAIEDMLGKILKRTRETHKNKTKSGTVEFGEGKEREIQRDF